MPDPLPRIFRDLSIYKLALGYLIKSIALNRPVGFVSLVQCPFSEHINPARLRRCFRLALFCHLLKVYQFWMCRMSILHHHQNATLHSLGAAATHPPHMKLIGWTVLDIIKMQTDTQIVLLLLERRICSAPHSEYLVLITTEALKLKKWYSAQPYWIPEVEFG